MAKLCVAVVSAVVSVSVVCGSAGTVGDGSNSLTTRWSSDWGPEPHNATDFTTFLWYGFSTDKVSFSPADFRELVECMTGRKRCPPINTRPAVSHLTDCRANTALTPAQCTILSTCGQSEVLGSYGVGTGEKASLSVEELRHLLPAVLYQSHRDHNCPNLTTHASQTHSRPQPSEIWGYGILFVTLISGCSLAGVSVLPLMAHRFYQQVLTLLVGLAVGSLAASSVFHLLPQAFNLAEKSTDGHHEYLFISLFVLIGIWGFFMIERFIKIIVLHQASKEERKNLPVSASVQAMLYETECALHSPDQAEGGGVGGGFRAVGVKEESYNKAPQLVTSSPPSNSCTHSDVTQIYQSQQQAIKASFGHSERPEKPGGHNHMIEFRQGQDSVIRTVAWMIIFGDGFHNFIDGVSIGAAFSESILTGISISLAVMCEELPHELGDFAVLLNAGMTMRQAVSYNFLSATTCYLGLFLGIFLGEFTQDTNAIFAVAAGMFLYIALVDMVPEMNEVGSKAVQDGWRSALNILLLQNIGIFIGISSLFCLAYFQDSMVLV